MSVEYFDSTAIPLTSQWIKTCLESHGSCQKSARHSSIFCTDNGHFINDIKGDGLVPTRLLGFNPTSKLEDMTISVIDSRSLNENTQYVALSHRWGVKEPQTLTTKNVTRLTERGIPLRDLPRTFRDAIQITHGLGYSYLWVDSLCIIQDDRHDWKREARRMAIVFDKAVLTIVAMDGIDCDAGLMVTDTPQEQRAVLDSRAWVCQEQMISPRSLIFTNESVRWECRECDASEQSPSMERRHSILESDQTPTHPKDIFVFFRDWRPRLLEGMEPKTPPTHSDWEDDDSGDDESLTGDSHAQGEESNQAAQSSGNELDESTPQDTLEQTEDINTTEHTRAIQEPSEDASSTSGPSSPQDITLVRSRNPSPVRVDYSGLPGHAARLREYWEFNGLDQGEILTIYPDHDSHEPFGSFSKMVTDLALPDEAYYPFIKTWWKFLSLYTPRLLTYETDRFLAINGVTSVAQRWTHVRNTFGLWFHFLVNELCWYIDPTGPQSSRPDEWLGPSWSWVSTRNARVKNDIWGRLPVEGKLQLKPEIRTPVGTSFDLPLSYAAWKDTKYHSMELHGNLREAEIYTRQTGDGEIKHEISLESWARFSDHAEYEFRPDCANQFPVGSTAEVYCLHSWHYDAEYLSLPEYTDVYIVLQQVAGKSPLTLNMDDVSQEDMIAERRMTRLGYLEAKYPLKTKRNPEEIEGWWRWIELV